MTPLLLTCPVCEAERRRHRQYDGGEQIWEFSCGATIALYNLNGALRAISPCRNALQNKLTELNNQRIEK